MRGGGGQALAWLSLCFSTFLSWPLLTKGFARVFLTRRCHHPTLYAPCLLFPVHPLSPSHVANGFCCFICSNLAHLCTGFPPPPHISLESSWVLTVTLLSLLLESISDDMLLETTRGEEKRTVQSRYQSLPGLIALPLEQRTIIAGSCRCDPGHPQFLPKSNDSHIVSCTELCDLLLVHLSLMLSLLLLNCPLPLSILPRLLQRLPHDTQLCRGRGKVTLGLRQVRLRPLNRKTSLVLHCEEKGHSCEQRTCWVGGGGVDTVRSLM